MKERVLEVDGLTGGYSRRRPVLRDVGFAVRPGELVGLLGLNGAGKSTLMKHIVGLLKPFAGTVRVNGHAPDDGGGDYRASLAFVPETPALYDELTVWEHLEWNAMAYGMKRDPFLARANRLLEEFRMTREKDKPAALLSKGMRQKVNLMCALLVRPPLYVVDEPFLGLDPLGIRSLLELMREEKENGSSLLVSTHILSMLESYCDRYVVLHEGRVAASGTADDVGRIAGTAPEGNVEAAFFRLIGADGP